MHWVIQNNIHREVGYDAFIEALDRQKLSYDLVKVIPFSHELEPDVNPENPVIAIGAYTMEQISKKKGWFPGVFTNENFTYEVWSEKYKGNILNEIDESVVVSFGDAVNLHKEYMHQVRHHHDLFIRPCKDGKEFAGMIKTWDWFQNWARKVLDLKEDYYKTITKDTKVMVTGLKKIYAEYRFFVVEGKVITGSQYKLGSRVTYRECNRKSDLEIYDFASSMAHNSIVLGQAGWQPAPAYVIDIAQTPAGPKIIEINCMNGAGFYACDMAKVVNAVENLTLKEKTYERRGLL